MVGESRCVCLPLRGDGDLLYRAPIEAVAFSHRRTYTAENTSINQPTSVLCDELVNFKLFPFRREAFRRLLSLQDSHLNQSPCTKGPPVPT